MTVMIDCSLRIPRLILLIGFLCFSGTTILAAADSPLEQMQARYQKRLREFSTEIQKLAADCDEKELRDAAKEVRASDLSSEFQSLRFTKLPGEVRSDSLPNAKMESWQRRLRRLRTEFAADLYSQAKLALRVGFPSHAYNLVREAALHDSDNAEVRRVLGYVRVKNEWVTTFASTQLKQDKVWHEEFGWLPRSHRDWYIAGERFFRDQWISEEKEKILRSDFNSAWQVRTDHYLIKTNVSLEKGVEMGKALEDFHNVFTETFAGFFHTPEQLQKLFEGKNSVNRSNPYVVHFYKSRDEYIERMQKKFPTIAGTNGVYLTTDRIAHFYLDPTQDQNGTLFHEATHQLFYESDRANRNICEKHHFWIIEGIACYMESFERSDNTFTLGNLNHIRQVGARNNLLRSNYYVPLNRFTSYGMQEFQTMPPPILAKNYTQASGLARFFMHHDNGRYREALVVHLTQLYSSDAQVRENAEDLDVLTGVSFNELDRQYAEDARADDQQAGAAPAAAKQAAGGRTDAK